METQIAPRFVKAQELAQTLGFSTTFIWQVLLPAGMPSVRVGHRRFFNIARCADWLEAQGDGKPKP